jgi:hypothetical protein
VIANGWGMNTAMPLPAFRAQGVTRHQFFFGKGKKSCFSVWLTMPELTFPLQLLSSSPPTLEMLQMHLQTFQQFDIIVYGILADEFTNFDSARHLKACSYCYYIKEEILNTCHQVALSQHLLRVVYQGQYSL